MINKGFLRRIGYLSIIGLWMACKSQPQKPVAKPYKSPCGCVISDEKMIMQCPIDAVGDSVAICKVGTNNVIGSKRPPMTWHEYIESEYFGGEGTVVDCKTGEAVLKDVKSPILSYKNKQLIVDTRYHFEVFDPKKKTWLDLELPVWRKIIYARNNELKTIPDSLIFKPARQGKEAFASVDKEYADETKRSDHYLITRTVYRLMSCAFCGDQLSEKRLLNILNDFADYYSKHPDSKVYYDESIRLYKAYQQYLEKGGKRKYYDLTQFVYFKKNG